MIFADLALSRRLERTEGSAAVTFAEARRRLFPESGAGWIQCGGAYAIFDGVDSPVTQTFGLGVFEELTPQILDELEAYFRERGAPVFHEVSPLAGVPAIDLLCARRYRPVEISNVVFQPVVEPPPLKDSRIRVRAIGPEDAHTWTDVSARGWSHEMPDLKPFLLQLGDIITAREGGICFLAELEGVPGAAGSLFLHDGTALFSGAATVPELRRRGLQAALLQERMRFAAARGCDLAMMVAMAGSESQRNAERKGFHVAYTRTKWRAS